MCHCSLPGVMWGRRRDAARTLAGPGRSGHGDLWWCHCVCVIASCLLSRRPCLCLVVSLCVVCVIVCCLSLCLSLHWIMRCSSGGCRCTADCRNVTTPITGRVGNKISKKRKSKNKGALPMPRDVLPWPCRPQLPLRWNRCRGAPQT